MLVVMNSFTPLMYLLIYWILRCTLKKCISTGRNALRLIPWLRYVRDFMKFFGFNSEQKKKRKRPVSRSQDTDRSTNICLLH